MTHVTNVDGDYFADDPRDHCKHGTYVGGCGYDFMCHACEMGEEDLTLRDAIAWVDLEAREIWKLHDEIPRLEFWEAVESAGHPSLITRSLARAIVARDGVIWFLEQLGLDPRANLDNDTYLSAYHGAQIEAYRRQKELQS